MRVAVIDDGICLDSARYIKKLAFDMECVGGAVKKRESEVAAASHGTIVGDILRSFSRTSQIGSIKIIHGKGRGAVQDLIGALRWCDGQGIRIVHMSIGTSCWQDFEMLEEAVRPLAGRLHLLAAENNMGHLSLPSALPGVWSESWLGQWCCEKNSRIQREPRGETWWNVEEKAGNAWRIQADLAFPTDLLEQYGDCLGCSNSYQAAAITGVLIEGGIFTGDQSRKREALCRILAGYPSGGQGRYSLQTALEHRSCFSENLLDEIPIVWVRIREKKGANEESGLRRGAYELLKEFHREGYYAAGLSGFGEKSEQGGVFWKEREVIDKNSVQEILEIYRCDLLLICSAEGPLEEADCLLEITEAEAVFYRKEEEKGTFDFWSKTDKTDRWYEEGKRFVLSCFSGL